MAGRQDSSTAGRRPNIVLIVADDLGFSDVGCYGGEIETPNIDALAAGGVRFTSFYNNAVCNPTRASLLTGLYPHQVDASDNVGLRPTGNVTIAEAMRSAGYATLLSGKWHNGASEAELPWNRGFERSYGLLSGCCNYFNPGLRRPGEIEPGHKRPDDHRPWGEDGRIMQPFTPDDPDFYSTDAFTDRAVQYLETYGRDERPFFLYLPYTAPHFPLHARPGDIEKYRGRYLSGWEEVRRRRHERLVEMGLIDERWSLSPRDEMSPRWDAVTDKEQWDLKMAVYAAMIDRMDQGIGRVLDALDRLGKTSDTLVMFLSDNGGCGEHIDRTPGVPPGPVDSYCTVDAAWANASNTPFRRFKAFDHEGGISTPFIASWPGKLEAGSICREVGHVIDLLPTFLELAGIPYPQEQAGVGLQPPEGISLAPALLGKPHGERALFWELRGCRAARVGDWKIVSEGEPRHHLGVPIPPGREHWELYDMTADRCELNDLSQEWPDVVRKLDAVWQDWHRRVTSA